MNGNYSPLSYTKETSKILKGIAILLMVFLHLFNRDSQIGLYDSFLTIDGRPFVQCFARACNPVGMFLFLSGYGLYYSFRQDRSSHNMGGVNCRVTHLYIRLWISYMIFVPLCILCVEDEKYPGSIVEALQNLFAYKNTWNHTTWFILPYAMVMLSYGAWFRKMLNYKSACGIFVISLVAYYMVALIYGRCYEQLSDLRPVLIACRYIEQLCPFLFGALICYFSKLRIPINLESFWAQKTLLFLIVLSFSYSAVKGIPFYPIYCGILMLLFANLQYGKRMSKMLVFLGRYSVMIWFVHTYFCDALLKSFIYGFKYPLLIFLVEMAISTLAAVIIEKIYAHVTRVKLLKLFE